MFGLGFPELIVILFIAFIIFGAGKLPEIGSGLGKALRGFKKEMAKPDEIDITPTAHPSAIPKGQEESQSKTP